VWLVVLGGEKRERGTFLRAREEGRGVVLVSHTTRRSTCVDCLGSVQSMVLASLHCLPKDTITHKPTHSNTAAHEHSTLGNALANGTPRRGRIGCLECDGGDPPVKQSLHVDLLLSHTFSPYKTHKHRPFPVQQTCVSFPWVWHWPAPPLPWHSWRPPSPLAEVSLEDHQRETMSKPAVNGTARVVWLPPPLTQPHAHPPTL